MRRISRWPIFTAVVLVLALGGLTSLAIATVRTSFPETSGRLMVSGLKGQVEVLRDSYGVPHIYADNPEDLFRRRGTCMPRTAFSRWTSGVISLLAGSRNSWSIPAGNSYLCPHAWLATRSRAGADAARAVDPPLSRRVRRWRQRLPRGPISRRHLAGVFAAPAARLALHPLGVDGRRFDRLAQGHGLGPGIKPHSGG